MPIYEFACNVCKNNFEQLLPISRMDDNANCPDCGRGAKRRLSVFMSFSTSSDGQISAMGGGGGCCGGGAGAGCACAGNS